MRGEAACFASTLERTGRLVLHQLKNMPKAALNWIVPFPECHSLFDFATRLIETNEFWVQSVVGGQPVERDDLLVELYRDGELAYLIARYERWLLNLHDHLDDFPDTLMTMHVVLPTFYSQELGDGPITVRDCLLYAVEQSALQSGRIQLMCQLYADFERLREELSNVHADDGMLLEILNREQLN
jgi:hypothetical protein